MQCKLFSAILVCRSILEFSQRAEFRGQVSTKGTPSLPAIHMYGEEIRESVSRTRRLDLCPSTALCGIDSLPGKRFARLPLACTSSRLIRAVADSRIAD